MTKKVNRKWLWALFIICFIPLFLQMGKWGAFLYTKSIVESANYCEVDSDCIDLGDSCYYGCSTFVNEEEADHINSWIEKTDGTCFLECEPYSSATCQQNKCQPIFNQ